MYATTLDAAHEVHQHQFGAGLGEAELKVIALARSDARRSGWDAAPAGWLGSLWQALTGADPVRPLADERLEKLRLFVCMMLRGDSRVEEAARALLAKGFQPYALKMVRVLAAA